MAISDIFNIKMKTIDFPALILVIFGIFSWFINGFVFITGFFIGLGIGKQVGIWQS